ncbi:MAG: long-chain fatty acid--CoA ligase [Paracoccaceae bacterium]
MQGLMMDGPLLISGVMRHAAEAFGAREAVESGPDGVRRTLRYDALPDRAARLANALARLGVARGDRVGTLAWNDLRHLEAYYAVSSMGAVCLTMNPRYAPEQLAYILDHAAPKVVLVDVAFVPLLAALMPKLASPPTVVVMADAGAQPETPFPALNHETLVAAESDAYDWPLDLDEREAAGLCYTSGTTGNPKGVLYSHRSTVLHAMMAVMPGACALSERETVMPVVPMFHVMAWGIPYAALIGGARMVLPGPRLDGASLWSLMEAEGVTMAAGVPTIWLGLLEEMRAVGRAPSAFRRTMVGGSAPSPALIRAYEEEFGVEFLHGWGMTEMSPVGTLGSMPPEMDGLGTEERIAMKAKQGRPVFGVSLAILDEDERALPWDGETRGRLCARGPWIASAYYRSDVSPLTSTGWLDTGDVATIDPQGFVTIVDRAKDLVKSGGEWISSIDVENAASTCPGVAMAAVIAVPHPKWDERPVIVVQPTAEDPADEARVLAHLGAKLPKWMVPDAVILADALPLGATGKVQKAKLREKHRDHLSGAA